MSLREQLPVYSPVTFGAVLDAGLALLGTGSGLRKVAQLAEEEFAPAALRLTGSGTVALAAALRIAGRGAARPLIALPAWACYDLATAADMVDARVVLYDLDPGTLGPDWSSFAEALSAGPSSAVVAHLYGFPVDMTEASRLAEAAGTVLVEDAAQGVGARYRGARAGSLAPLAVLSFGRGKGRTGGRGGALLANASGFAAEVGGLRLDRPRGAMGELARLKAQWLLGRPAVYGLLTAIPQLGLGETVYRAPEPMRAMSRISGAALARTWSLEPGETAARRRNAGALLAWLDRHPTLGTVAGVDGAEPGYLRLPVVARTGAAAQFIGGAARRLGIMPGYPKALPDLAGFDSRIVNRTGSFPRAGTLARSLGTLPTHSRLTERDLGKLRDWLVSVGRS